MTLTPGLDPMSEPASTTVSWSWFLPREAVVAIVEGGLLAATLFGWEGGEFVPAMWLVQPRGGPV